MRTADRLGVTAIAGAGVFTALSERLQMPVPLPLFIAVVVMAIVYVLIPQFWDKARQSKEPNPTPPGGAGDSAGLPRAAAAGTGPWPASAPDAAEVAATDTVTNAKSHHTPPTQEPSRPNVVNQYLQGTSPTTMIGAVLLILGVVGLIGYAWRYIHISPEVWLTLAAVVSAAVAVFGAWDIRTRPASNAYPLAAGLAGLILCAWASPRIVPEISHATGLLSSAAIAVLAGAAGIRSARQVLVVGTGYFAGIGALVAGQIPVTNSATAALIGALGLVLAIAYVFHGWRQALYALLSVAFAHAVIQQGADRLMVEFDLRPLLVLGVPSLILLASALRSRRAQVESDVRFVAIILPAVAGLLVLMTTSQGDGLRPALTSGLAVAFAAYGLAYKWTRLSGSSAFYAVGAAVAFGLLSLQSIDILSIVAATCTLLSAGYTVVSQRKGADTSAAALLWTGGAVLSVMLMLVDLDLQSPRTVVRAAVVSVTILVGTWIAATLERDVRTRAPHAILVAMAAWILTAALTASVFLANPVLSSESVLLIPSSAALFALLLGLFGYRGGAVLGLCQAFTPAALAVLKGSYLDEWSFPAVTACAAGTMMAMGLLLLVKQTGSRHQSLIGAGTLILFPASVLLLAGALPLPGEWVAPVLAVAGVALVSALADRRAAEWFAWVLPIAVATIGFELYTAVRLNEILQQAVPIAPSDVALLCLGVLAARREAWAEALLAGFVLLGSLAIRLVCIVMDVPPEIAALWASQEAVMVLAITAGVSGIAAAAVASAKRDIKAWVGGHVAAAAGGVLAGAVGVVSDDNLFRIVLMLVLGAALLGMNRIAPYPRRGKEPEQANGSSGSIG